jgi:nitrate reductase NapE component
MHILEDLSEELNAQKDRRRQLLSYWIIFTVVAFGCVALPRMAVRFYGATGFFVTMFLATAIMTTIGLTLLVQTIYAQREINAIKAEMKEAKRKLRRKDNGRNWWRLWDKDDDSETYYTLGTDGELIEVQDDQ